jgi:UDP-2-acetamido-3-amino-2,3-dideoxy-glucuronate N-acetyltransferase
MKTSLKPNIAVIGCGYWGKNLIRTAKELGCLATVVDKNLDLQKEINNNFNLPNIGFESVLADNKIEGIIIATTADTHFEIGEKCLKNGKHVFIEKPICLSIDDAEKLNALSLKFNKILMTGHLLQYHDHFIALKKKIKSQELGKICKVKSVRKSLGIIRDYEDVIWSFSPHDLSMIFSLFENKEFCNVEIKRQKYFSTNTDKASIFFEIDGVQAEIEVDWTSVEKEQKIEVYCERGIIVFNDANKDINKKLYLISENFSLENLKTKTSPEINFLTVSSDGNPLKNECKAFLDAIKTNKNPVTDYCESSHVLRFLIEAERL